MPARKRTKFMTNSSEIANELSWKCPKDHLHQALVGAGPTRQQSTPKASVRPSAGASRGNQAIQNECQGVDDSDFHGQNWNRYE